MSTTIKRQSTISTSLFSNWNRHAEKCEICKRVKILQKWIIGKRMLKVKTAQKGISKNDVKHSTWFQSFFNFLSSQIKSDDIALEMGKANKSVKMRTQILFKLFDSMFFKWKK